LGKKLLLTTFFFIKRKLLTFLTLKG